MWEKELQTAIEAGKEAQKIIMDIYNKGFDVEIKEDNSPVTNADKSSDALIRKILSSKFPSYAFLTEEGADDKSRLLNDFVWIIDPLDGTKDFVAKDDEFTINIALAYKHKVVVGVVVIPATGEIYYASDSNGAFYLKPNSKPVKIHVNNKIKNLTCLTSVFHTNEKELNLINKHKDLISDVYKKGSSIKACLIAQGKAEVSFRMGSGTKEWDTAASQIIVIEAGGIFLEPDGKLISYNRDDVYNRKGYIIANCMEVFMLQ